MENLNVIVDAKEINGLKKVKITFPYPTCHCEIILESAYMDTDKDEEDIVQTMLFNAEKAMRKCPFCPKCGHNWLRPLGNS